MQRVRISVERLRSYGGDTVFEVYGNLGTGPIDFFHPLTPRPVALWPQAARRSGHLLDGHVSLRHTDSVDPDGHLEGAHLRGGHLHPALAVTFDTPPYVFGRFEHAVRMVDGAGNESEPTIVSVTVNSAPSVPGCPARSGYDPQADRLTFWFCPSRFEAVPGK
jgi:hypothetical protein